MEDVSVKWQKDKKLSFRRLLEQVHKPASFVQTREILRGVHLVERLQSEMGYSGTPRYIVGLHLQEVGTLKGLMDTYAWN
jgi:hypothetical protein